MDSLIRPLVGFNCLAIPFGGFQWIPLFLILFGGSHSDSFGGPSIFWDVSPVFRIHLSQGFSFLVLKFTLSECGFLCQIDLEGLCALS